MVDTLATMLKVAIDAGPLHGQRTGIGNAVGWTLEALASAADPDVVLLPYIVSLRARPTPPQRRLPLPAAAAHRLWARSSTPRMDRWLGHPDLVHGTNYVVPPTAASRLVSVYDCWFLEHPSSAHPDVARSGAVLRRAVDEGAHVLASSDATANKVRALLNTDQVHTIHLGPPPTQPVPETPPADLAAQVAGRPFILALGTVERRKNLLVLITAFERLAREHPDIILVVAGRDGDDSEPVSRGIAQATPSVRKRIVRLGVVDPQSKQWLLHHAECLAYPSLDEGFGFPVLEAQIAGTPVVSSSAGSIPEVAGAGALLSLPSDSDALAANLFWTITNQQKRASLIAAGHLNLERFSWATTARSLLDLYRQLADQS
ncbi:MAG: glycosyltransferase involved in cell wall biosynthesis [Ilumatobacter sp.]